jgi:hypothetical protein
MGDMDRLLEYVQKTNPDMTIDKLLEELKKSRYAAIGLVISTNGKDSDGM